MRSARSRVVSPLVAIPVAVVTALAGSALPASADPGGDNTPPRILVQIDPSPFEGWYGHPVPVTISATDAGGIEGFGYRLSGAQTGEEFSEFEGLSVTVGAQGVSTFDITATDVSGNRSTLKYGVGVDLTDPTLEVGGTLVHGSQVVVGATRTVVFGCGDVPTGVATCTATNDGDPLTSGQAVDTSWVGDHSVVVTAVDRVGRTTVRTLNYRVDLPPLTIVSNPVLEGSPTRARVNQELRVGGAVFSPTPGYFIYEWFVDGVHVADGRTFTPQAAHLGKRVSVQAFGSWVDGYAETRTPAVGNLVVEAGPLQLTRPPTLEGAPSGVFPGEELRVFGGGFNPTATTVTYRWYADDELVGTGQQYTARTEDVGRRLSVEALGVRAGYLDTVSARVGQVPVVAQQFRLDTPPRVTGTVRVGQQVSIGGGSVTPAATSVRNLWTVGTTVIETDAPRLLLGREHAGKRLSCVQVFSSPGYADLRTPCLFAGGATSVAIPGVAVPTWRVTSRAGIVGKARVRSLLRAVRPRTSAPARSWAYQWLRNGKLVRGATKATYRVRRADRGDRIAVRITVRATGMPTLTSVSTVKRIRR